MSIFKNAALFLLAMAASVGASDPVVIRSGPEHTPLVELYTSEGCSSCPPADAWFARLRQRGDLWKAFVPVVFHVDYWNGLGWPDRFSSRDFSERQRTYAAAWRTSTVYTPGLVLDGAEWTAWRGAASVPAGAREKVGVLEVMVKDRASVEVSFSPAAKMAPPAQVELALLGMAQETKVARGENGGRTLRHEFVVLHHQAAALAGEGGSWLATLALPAVEKVPATVIAVWVTRGVGHPPVQAAGGWLSAQ